MRDSVTVKEIKFQGRDFILTDGGAITTEEDYKHGLVSYAYVFGDVVKRFNQVIGAASEIVQLGEKEVKFEDDFLHNILTSPGWLGPANDGGS